MHLTRTSRRAAAFAVGSVASPLLVAGPAGASAQTFTAHDSEPVAVSPNGHTVDFDRGDCAQPEDG